MILLLDGYNVIHIANIAQASALRERRKALIRLATAYCLRKKGIQLLIFFDSKEQVFLNEPANAFVRVIFTETGSADDAIIDWIKRHRPPAEIQVVTDDNELRERTKTLGAAYICVAELMKRLDFNGSRESAGRPQERRSGKESGAEKFMLHSRAAKEINQTLPPSWFQ